MGEHGDGGLPWVAGRLIVTFRSAQVALRGATAALLGGTSGRGDLTAAQRALQDMRAEIENLAPERPLGTAEKTQDVRTTVAVVHLGGDAQRLAELTQQIADIAWSRRSRPMPELIRSTVEAMSTGVLSLVERAGATASLKPTDAVGGTAVLDHDLEAVAAQQRVLDEVLVSGDPSLTEIDAVDVALLGRCYEGCARHAVSAARHVSMLSS